MSQGLLYDSHVHLSDPEYAPYLEETRACLARTNARACCVSTNAADSARTLEIASDYILPFVGLHPEFAQEGPDGVCNIIRDSAQTVAGIGEIGLDPTLGGPGGAAAQERAFAAQLCLAEELGKPVSIHSRKSLKRVLDCMGSYKIAGACLHWFDGGKKELRRAAEMGIYCSFGPVMVYAKDKQSLLAAADLSLVLFETDGPVRFSRCFGSRPAQPSMVASVAFCAASALKMPYEDLVLAVQGNTERFLGI